MDVLFKLLLRIDAFKYQSVSTTDLQRSFAATHALTANGPVGIVSRRRLQSVLLRVDPTDLDFEELETRELAALLLKMQAELRGLVVPKCSEPLRQDLFGQSSLPGMVGEPLKSNSR